MRLGLNLGYWGSGAQDGVALAQEAERLGFDSVWVAEAYGSDALTPLTWVAAQTSTIKVGTAIMQMPARTPAMTAMSAATLDLLTGGRMLLGLGLSGPQVVEGWHGEAYGKPLVKSREYVDIVRTILRREKPLEHHGRHYDIPYRGSDATGLGKPLKLIIHPLRADIPIYLAAIGPKNVALTAEIAEGWLPTLYSPSRHEELYGESLRKGFAAAGDGRSEEDFDIAPSVPVVLGDDIDNCRMMVKPFIALYVGGMGAKGKNFYYDIACRYGYEDAADQIQKLYLAGDKVAAMAAVPDEFVDEVALVGPKERIAELLEKWNESPVTTLICAAQQPEALQAMAELVL